MKKPVKISIKRGALWSKEKNGETYLSGKDGERDILVWPNQKKTKENQPDYYVYETTFAMVEEVEKDERGETL